MNHHSRYSNHISHTNHTHSANETFHSNHSSYFNQVLKSYSVCTSNLCENDKLIAEDCIREMGGIHHMNMMKSTKTLISNKINTDKCMVASLQNIPIVSIDWINMCHKKRKFVDHKEFLLKCFHGIKISLLGFDIDEEISIKTLIEENEGKVINSFEESDVIVIKSSLFLSNSNLNLEENYEYKIVIEKWVYDCIEAKNFIKLNTASYKYKNDLLKQKFEKIEKENLSGRAGIVSKRKLLQKEKKNSSKNRNSRKNIDNEENYNDTNINIIFSKLIFYISTEFNKETKDILVKSISLGGGLVYNKVSPLTTHIICNDTKDNITNRALSFGIYFKPELVNPYWVVESLKERTLLSPLHYRPISSFHSLLKASNTQVKSEIYLTTNVISNIFKNQKFFIYSESYSEEEFTRIKENILEHGGLVLDPSGFIDDKNQKIQQISIKAKYIIINDGYSQGKMANLIERKIDDYQYIMSHRFVDTCIQKRTLINISNQKFIHVLPFQNQVPFQDFIEKKITAYFYGFPLLECNSMEHFLETLGGVHDISKKTTHIICKEFIKFDDMNRYKTKYGENILFVGFEWLFECLIEGHVVREEKFLIKIIENKEVREAKEEK